MKEGDRTVTVKLTIGNLPDCGEQQRINRQFIQGQHHR